MKKLSVILLVLVLVLALPALAQNDQAATDQSLSELRAEAARLTALAAVPEAGRAEAEELLQRLDALSESTDALEMTRLRAYIAALRAGDSASVAEEVAAAAIAEDSVALARDREALRADVDTFLETYPAAATVLRRAALSGAFGWSLSEDGRSGLLGGMALRLHQRSSDGRSFELTLPFGGVDRFERSPGQRDDRRGPGDDAAPALPSPPAQEDGSGA